MVRCYRTLLSRFILAFAGMVHSFDLDEVILKDMIYPGSDVCSNNDGNTDISYIHTPSPSTWASVNSGREVKNFMAEMTHVDPDPNRSWTARFGKGGSIYSMRSGYGEAIPPQTDGTAPWVDEVTQSVSVDLIQNKCSEGPSQCYFIHQAGTYFEDLAFLDEPFYSPNVGRHCEGNTCIFATWGQIAKNPTIFESDLLYFHQYRDCGNGVLEYTQMFVGYFGGQIAFLNVPWAGVRRSSLPDLYFSNIDLTMSDKEDSIHGFGVDTKLIELQKSGGYSTFAQNVENDVNDNAALSYVHGINEEYSDSTNKYFRAPSRIRYGEAGRDFTVFTINGRLTSRNPDNSFVFRQFIINDRLGNIEAQAQPLITESFGDMLTSSDFNGRTLEVYFEDSSHFGVAAASQRGGTSTTCARGGVSCSGSSVPGSGRVPFFTIKCDSLSYFGPDRYHFNPGPDESGKNRSYVCAGQGKGVVPEWKLMGFFQNGDCSFLSNAIYDPVFCDEEPPSKTPTASPTKSPTSSPTTSPTKSPTSSPTTSPTKSPTSSPTTSPTKSPTSSPTTSPTKLPTSNPTTSPMKLPTTSPTKSPASSPTTSPTKSSTLSPTTSPTKSPTSSPTTSPTKSPTSKPTTSPTKSPISSPTTSPTKLPTLSPTNNPTKLPTLKPTTSPTKSPTLSPTTSPTKLPTLSPTTSPTKLPTSSPTNSPAKLPTSSPTNSPTKLPTSSPTTSPTKLPTSLPTTSPTKLPTSSPTTSSPTIAPSFSQLCSEESDDQFLLDIKDGMPRVRSCMFLSKRSKNNQKKICRRQTEFGEFKKAEDVCRFTCGVRCPTTDFPSLSPTVACEEKPNAEFAFKMQPSGPKTRTCFFLSRLLKSDKQKANRLCTSGFEIGNIGSAADICPNTCQSCRPDPTCKERPNAEFVFRLQPSGPKTRTCFFLSNLMESNARKANRLCKSGLSFGDIGSAADICPNTCQLCDRVEPILASTVSFNEKSNDNIFLEMQEDDPV